jgi:nitric oxide reductase NorQ protein
MTIEIIADLSEPQTVALDRINNLEKLSAKLPELLIAIGSQAVNADFAEIVKNNLSKSGGLTMRGSAETTKKKVKEKVAETLSADEALARPNGELYYTRNWGEHKDTAVLKQLRSISQFALFYGNAGTGKTALVEATFGSEVHTILGSGDTEVADLVGGYVQTPSGNFEWIDGALVKAAENGEVLFIDEIGLIDPKVLSVVYGLMDGRRELPITQNQERGTVKAKEGFYVVGATNPNAPGVVLSEALLSRFTAQVEITTDWVLAKKLGVPAIMTTASQNLAKKQLSGEVSWCPQMRELLAFRDLEKVFGTKWAVSNLISSAPELDRPIVAEVLSRVYGEEVKTAKI